MCIPKLEVQPDGFYGLFLHQENKHIWYSSQMTEACEVTFDCLSNSKNTSNDLSEFLKGESSRQLDITFCSCPTVQ